MRQSDLLPEDVAVTQPRWRLRTFVVLAAVGGAVAVISAIWPSLRFLPGMLAMGWRGGLGTFNGVVLYWLLGVPVAALCVCLLTWARNSDDAWRKSLAEVGIVYGTAPWLWMTMMPGAGAGVVPGRVSLVPLKDLFEMTPLGVGGNLLVFAALGFFGPVRFRALSSLPRIMLLAAACSALIEIAQFVFRLGRVSSADDVLLNTVGAGLAAIVSRRWWATRAIRVSVPSERRSSTPSAS